MTTLRDALTEAMVVAIHSAPNEDGLTTDELLGAILAHPAMRAIEAKVALAEAVEELLEEWHWVVEYDRRGGGVYYVKLNPLFNGQKPREGTAATLLDALRAAKGERS